MSQETRTVTTIKQPYFTNDGTKLFLSTSTKVDVDGNGKYIPNSAVVSLRLHDTTSSVLGTDFKTVATRDAGKPWNLTKDGNGNTVAGASLQQTLANRNSLTNINLNNHVSNALQAPLQGVPAGDVNTNTQASSNAATGGPPTAGAAPATTPVDGVPPTNTIENLKALAKGIPGRPPRQDYDNLYYPLDIGKTESDVIKFTMIRYGTKTYQENSFSLSNRSLPEGEKEIKGSVTMSIQPTITDSNIANWSGLEMGMLGAAAAGASLEIIDTGSVDGLANKLTNVVNTEGTGLEAAILATLAQEAAGTKGLLTRLTGAMFNNNLELLFQGPQLRQFPFTFKMSPRSKDESEQVRKIIRFFKQGGAVQRSTTNLFLKSPNIFEIKYLHRGTSDHKYLNRIKTCALINCTVDYTPTGSYMTYEDGGSMVSYTLTLQFSELEPVYEDEYQILDGANENTFEGGVNDSGGIGY